MAKTGKRLKNIYVLFDKLKVFPLSEAVKILKESSKVKFDETVDVAVNLGVDPRHADQMVRGVVSLPHGTGKCVRVAVFCRGEKAELVKNAGADIVGAEDLAEQIQKGQINFDRCIATPDMMGVVGRVARILGPKGLMPNPKLGTVTVDIEEAVRTVKAGQLQFRVEKNGIVHAGVGKMSFSQEQIEENIKALLEVLLKLKPSGAKGMYFRKVSISSTMGPGIIVTPASVLAG